MRLERYGLKWNGPENFVATEMPDGHWTPWHKAKEVIDNLANYQKGAATDLVAYNKMITELETKLQETIENAMTQAHTLRVINNGLEAENIRLKMSIEFGLKEFAKRCNAMESDQ
jgi:hypothetical protein